MGSALADLERKGNLEYAEELYNPRDRFECVVHVSFWPEDVAVRLRDPRIEVCVLRLGHRRWLYAGRVRDAVLAYRQIVALCRDRRVDVIRARGVYHAS